MCVRVCNIYGFVNIVAFYNNSIFDLTGRNAFGIHEWAAQYAQQTHMNFMMNVNNFYINDKKFEKIRICLHGMCVHQIDREWEIFVESP